MKKILAIAISLALVLMLVPMAIMAEGNTLTVGATGDYATIAEAVAAASAGDTVQLVDDIVERQFTISKALTIDTNGHTWTAYINTAENIKKASILSMYAGADFIKTSTGKQQPAATPEAAYVMCQAIKEYYEQTGIKVGFKPAGGINCVNDALIYYTIVKEVLGDEWLTNKLFRLGTSRLANLLLSEIVGEDLKFF